jgi:hypothetical protein
LKMAHKPVDQAFCWRSNYMTVECKREKKNVNDKVRYSIKATLIPPTLAIVL